MANLPKKIHGASGGLEKEVTISEDGPSQNTTRRSRLSMLKNLVQDVIDDPDISEADSEVMKAISQLQTAFRQSIVHTSSINESPSALPRHSLPQPARVAGKSSSQTPPLPPISDSQLEKAVFTHPAYANGHDANYDRLEVLGDAYIELIATKMVWESFPGIPSGRISQIRELLVKNETLAGFAEIYHLDRKASIPVNYADQAKRWTKTMGDIFEAYVAAIVLSHPHDGYQIAERWLTALWRPKVLSLGHQKAELRSKEDLAKKVMGRGVKLEYTEEQPSVEKKGTGTQTFFIGVYLTGWGWHKRHLGSGQGSSKTAAGDEAAKDALRNVALISEITTARQSLIHRKE
ncbi:hypothetical protein N7492_000837 [Penicillium capsulatum]|uniref:RNase III domain-containing protein n=1 Tax=Penicillium capsulatum TaxID=69766 RepID=A0A9W9LYW8_9EURO|nr:hypothetical protein N7492_000837 [Penicillium capsulatum]